LEENKSYYYLVMFHVLAKYYHRPQSACILHIQKSVFISSFLSSTKMPLTFLGMTSSVFVSLDSKHLCATNSFKRNLKPWERRYCRVHGVSYIDCVLPINDPAATPATSD